MTIILSIQSEVRADKEWDLVAWLSPQQLYVITKVATDRYYFHHSLPHWLVKMGAPCQPIKQVLPLSWTNFLVSVLRISGPLSEYWASLQGRVMVLGMLMYLLSLVVSGLTGETLDWMSSYITCHHFYNRAEWSRKQCHNVTPPLLGIYWGENNYVLISTMDHIKCLLSLPPFPSLSRR